MALFKRKFGDQRLAEIHFALEPEREENVQVMERPITKPRPIPASEITLPDSLTEYLELSEQLGYSSIEAIGSQVKLFLVENNIPVYDINAVESYLWEVVKKERKRQLNRSLGYDWKPLKRGSIDAYRQTVPIEMLRRAAKIKAAYPNAAFFVSAIVDYPDPFIKGSIDGFQFVFGVWDEPGF